MSASNKLGVSVHCAGLKVGPAGRVARVGDPTPFDLPGL